ncbi:MAG TPA: M48 family metallopeptidase [Vicinamibacterales bacterium]
MSSAGKAYALSGTIEPTRLSAGYRVGLLVVAIAMLVLPLVYLGLIAVVARAVWWHVSANTWMLTSRGGGLWRFVGYFGPIVAGGVLAFFMVKPVLARPARQIDPVPIELQEEPALFGFITEICRQVRAPIPTRVQVDCQVNASASFATIPISIGPPRLVLTIGLPLAAGLTVRQFGGVLAHEFGHFAQGGAMRLTFIVRSINRWFSRVVHERDAWDEQLAEWSSGGNWMVVLTLKLAQASIWCSRHALAGLMKIGHAISCFMLRQMEYDADSYEMKLVGTGAFIETSARLREMNVFAEVGHSELREGWLRRTMPSNLPAFLLQQHSRFPPDVLGRVRQVPDARTGLFDTHPSDADRIRAAEHPGSAGILAGGDVSASALFHDFNALSERATRHYYEHDLGINLDAASLVDTEAALLATHDRDDIQRAAQAFFGDRLSVLRPLRVDPPDGAYTIAELVAAIDAARAAMASEEGRVAEKYRGYDSLEHNRQLALTAHALIESGFAKVVPDGFNLAQGTSEEAEAAAARAVSQQERLAPALARFEGIATRRLACALALLRASLDDPSTTAFVDLDLAARTSLAADGERLRATLNALADVWGHLNQVHEAATLYEHLCANAPKSPNQDLALARMNRATSTLGAAIKGIRTKLAGVPGPHAESSDALLTMIGVPADPASQIEADLVLAKTAALRFDVIGRLAGIALRVEDAIAATKDMSSSV